MRSVILAGVATIALLFGIVEEPAARVQDGPSAANLEKLRYGLDKGVWVAYAPTGFNPDVNPPIIPSDESIRADLIALREAGFDGLVTYGADLPSIPMIAEQEGMRWLLLGIWDPANFEEIRRTKEAARSEHVLGIIVGNEGLMFRRYSNPTLLQAMLTIRADTGKPVTTTEVIESYYTTPELAQWSDFLAVNAHPFFHSITDPKRAADWTALAYQRLAEQFPHKPILFKEVGLPTDGVDGLSEQSQLEYYAALMQTPVKFVFFEAFDALFKNGPIEKSWGLFRADRRPKLVVSIVRKRQP